MFLAFNFKVCYVRLIVTTSIPVLDSSPIRLVHKMKYYGTYSACSKVYHPMIITDQLLLSDAFKLH